MDKQQFNSMEFNEQKNYINELLQQKSLTKICEDIGISRSTITKRFKKYGFIYDKRVNMYQLVDNPEPSNDTIDTKVLLDMIKKLENRVSILEQQQCNSSATEVQQTNNNDIMRFYKGDTVVRAYRIDEEVYQRFKHYTDENKHYKVSDIISTALERFLEDIEAK